MLLQKSITILICISLTGAQVLNGYINPLWMSDRRPKANSLYNAGQSSELASDFYMTRGGLYSNRPELKRVSEYYYMDELGRYRPVYRKDRLITVGSSQFYAPAEQKHQEYIALPPNTPTIEHHDEHADNEEEAKLI